MTNQHRKKTNQRSTNKRAPGSAFLPAEITKKLAKVERELEQMASYKAILRLDGMQPDEADKEKESRLLAQLRKLQKMSAGKWIPDAEYRPDRPQNGRPSKPKAKTSPAVSQPK